MGRKRERTDFTRREKAKKRESWELLLPWADGERQAPWCLLPAPIPRGHIPPPPPLPRAVPPSKPCVSMWGLSDGGTKGGYLSFSSVANRPGPLQAGRLEEGGAGLLLAFLGSWEILRGDVERREPSTPPSYLCILDILCSSMSSLPRNPLAKGLFSIFNWVICGKERDRESWFSLDGWKRSLWRPKEAN